MAVRTLFLATGNRDKIREIRNLLDPLQIEVRTIDEFPGHEEIDEDLPDLEGNALKKARIWHQRTGLPALSDDTGLEVDALGGEPGVRSARYAGEGVTYSDNVNLLLKKMDGKRDRKARFRTVVALVDYEGEHLFEGICTGVITTEIAGEGGFGYDPVFRPEEYDRTFAELSVEEKNSISHRGLALQKVVQFLKEGRLA
ncbi:MAG: RdgB/HAM1 family non-canonical purine NTP pyrophosphatase [Balneolaceae bacterium]